MPLAIYPHPEEKVFSGATLVEEDHVIAMYHGTMVGNMVAVSSDPLLLNWEKVSGRPVVPIANPNGSPLPYQVFDPAIWNKGGVYYSLYGGQLPAPGGKYVRANYLLRSKDLENWTYLHPFVEDDRYSLVGDDGACPYFWPIGDKHILLPYSHMSGGKFLLGDYDKARDKFVATGGGDFNFGASRPGGVHAPSATPDGTGGVIVIFNMNDAMPAEGWNQIMTLPRRLTLAPEGDVDEVRVEPAGDIESLRREKQSVGATTLPANQEIILENIRGNAIEIAATTDSGRASTVELNVLRSANAEEVTRILFYRRSGYRRNRASPTQLVSNHSLNPELRSANDLSGSERGLHY